MPLTRRSVLRTMAALTAGTTLPSFARAASAVAHKTQPDMRSIFILFEGPWIISHVRDENQIRGLLATTLGAPHFCEMGLWNKSWTPGGEQPQLINPFDPNPKVEAAYLIPGDALSGKIVGVRAEPPSFTDLFDAVSKRCEGFVYIRNKESEFQGCKPDNPMDGDRRIQIPMPDAAYIGGLLTHGRVQANSGILHGPTGLCTTFIFEYTQPATSLTISNNQAPVFSLCTGDILIFRLQYDPTQPDSSDARHVKATFDKLAEHFKQDMGLGVQFPGKQDDTEAATGDHVDGFTRAQLGLPDDCHRSPKAPSKSGKLKPVDCAKSSGHANCAGGGIVVGP